VSLVLRVQRYDYFSNHQNFLKKKCISKESFLHFLISVNLQDTLHLIIIIYARQKTEAEQGKQAFLDLKVKNMQKNLAVCKNIGNFAAHL